VAPYWVIAKSNYSLNYNQLRYLHSLGESFASTLFLTKGKINFIPVGFCLPKHHRLSHYRLPLYPLITELAEALKSKPSLNTRLSF